MKNVSIRKRVIAMLLVAAMLVPMAAYFSDPDKTTGRAMDDVTVATPTSQKFLVKEYGKSAWTDISDKIPVYMIIQDNGWGANYVKLRDIAYFCDFFVSWSPDAPDEVRIYTDRHYLEPLNTDMSEPLQEEVATRSTMKIYVDDVLAEGVEPYMIRWNNYLKVRQIAQIVNFACIFSTTTYKEGAVFLETNYPYKDGDLKFTSANYPTPRVIQYDSPMWFDQSSGQLYDEPVKQLPNNPWAREDWYSTYASDSLKKWANDGGNPLYVQSLFNGLVQVLLDEDKIATDNSGADIPMMSESWRKAYPLNKLNTYYMYPFCYGGGSSFSVTSLGYHTYDGGRSFRILAPGWYPGTTGYEAIELTKTAAADILAKAETYQTDREKVRYLVEEVCDKITYISQANARDPLGYSAVKDGSFWNSGLHYQGNCMSFELAFEYIAAAAGLNWIHMEGDNHEWAWVWLKEEGKWVVVDATNADGADFYKQPGMESTYYNKYVCIDPASYVKDFTPGGVALLIKEVVEVINRLS